MFCINVNHPVGDSALSKRSYSLLKWSSDSKAVSLLHSFLNLMKEDIATGSQWKKYCWKTMIQFKKTSFLVYFLWSYISEEWQEKFELEPTFYEIIKESKNPE